MPFPKTVYLSKTIHEISSQKLACWKGLLIRLESATSVSFKRLEEIKREECLAAHAHVLKSHGVQLGGIEEIFRVDDDRALQQVFDLAKVERAEFRPAGTDHERVDTLGCRVGGVAVADAAVQMGFGFGECDRDPYAVNARALLHESLRQADSTTILRRSSCSV